jgi:energy-coupling factor transport system ATP-binding protein
MAKIEVKNLSYSYTKQDNVLKQVSFQIQEGSFVSIIGHNGSGKSTIAKLLIGLLNPAEGNIFIDGVELNDKTVKEIRKKVALVIQNPDNHFIGATVEDDIAFGLENRLIEHDKMQSIIEEFASKVGMLDFLKEEPTNLSGGQKQRVAIAGVLALTPEILILDEATSMLDPKGKNEIKNIIKSLRETNKNLTIVSITHDIEEAYLSDEVIIINNGEVALQGNPKELFKNFDMLEKYRLDIPFALKLQKELKDNNIDLHSTEIEDIAEELCR